MKTVGDQAREYRESMGWNTTRMAAEVSRRSLEKVVKRQNIEGLEAKGDRKPHFIAALALTMGTTVDELLAGTFVVKEKGVIVMNHSIKLQDDALNSTFPDSYLREVERYAISRQADASKRALARWRPGKG